jgi:hypothetical protein
MEFEFLVAQRTSVNSADTGSDSFFEVPPQKIKRVRYLNRTLRIDSPEC